MSTYLHTIVVYIALCLFAFEIYAVPATGLGSPGSVWQHLTDIATKVRGAPRAALAAPPAAALCLLPPWSPRSWLASCWLPARARLACARIHPPRAHHPMPAPVPAHLPRMQGGAFKGPVENNKGGSYITMFSQGGLIFGIINIVGNFGTVFLDQAYWMGAIASKPSASYKGYILGGLMWFSIPFTLATSLGLAAVALDLPLTKGEAGEGLVPPAVAEHILGNAGAVWIT